MISTQLVILLLAVAALAFYAGYQFGRQAAGSEAIAQDRGTLPGETNGSPLPGPRSIDTPRSAPPPASAGGEASRRSSSAAPPASAGERGAGETSAREPRQEPRRTSAPPPARAGLLDPGDHGGKK